MSDQKWNPWKVTAIGMAVVFATALITGLVVANWAGNQRKDAAQTTSRPPAATAPMSASARPSPADIESCNQYAKSVVASPTTEVVKDALIGGAIGAGVGAAGGAIAGGGKGAGKGAAIGGIVGATAGTLYGLNESKQHDARYVDAYRTCMKRRGYTA
jgi:hypothetical protein